MKTSFYTGSTLVPITALVMGSAPLGTQLLAECTANVTSTGRVRHATSPTAGTTAAAPTTDTATSPGRSCVSAMTVGKVKRKHRKYSDQKVEVELKVGSGPFFLDISTCSYIVLIWAIKKQHKKHQGRFFCILVSVSL